MDDGQWVELFKHCVCLWSFGAYGTSMDISKRYSREIFPLSQEPCCVLQKDSLLCGRGRENGLKFELSLDDHAKLSRKALESGCSLEELVARHLHSIL